MWAPGAVLGGVAAAAMQGPSLFPKDPKLQRIGTVAAALLALGVGTGVEAGIRGIGDRIPGDHLTAQLAVGGTGAALAGGIAVATRGRVTGGRALARSGGTLLAVGGGAGAASTLVSRADDRLPGPGTLAQVGLAAVAGTAVLGMSLRSANAAKGMSHLMPDLPELAADGATFGKLAVDHGLDARGPMTSGGTGSVLPWEQLPEQGKRFLSEMPRSAEIDQVMEATGSKDPIRLYASLAHAEGLDEAAAVTKRVDLIMEEADRLGTFGRFEQLPDKSTKVLEQPRESIYVHPLTSSGFANPVAVSSHEFMHLGDTASFAVQVGVGKAAGEMHHVARATATSQQLMERISERIASMPEGMRRPLLRQYGESFGAWAGQNGFAPGGEGNLVKVGQRFGKWNGRTAFNHAPPSNLLARFDELGVDHTMYTGTPSFSKLAPRLLADPALTGGAKPKVVKVRNLEDAKALSPGKVEDVRVTLLQHDADPVGLFHPRLLWEKTPHLAPHQRWYVGVSGIQTALDQQMAQYFKSGTLEAKGHDYRSEVTYVMRRAFPGPRADAMTDGHVARVREWNRQLEEIHDVHLAQRAAQAARPAD